MPAAILRHNLQVDFGHSDFGQYDIEPPESAGANPCMSPEELGRDSEPRALKCVLDTSIRSVGLQSPAFSFLPFLDTLLSIQSRAPIVYLNILIHLH